MGIDVRLIGAPAGRVDGSSRGPRRTETRLGHDEEIRRGDKDIDVQLIGAPTGRVDGSWRG